MSLDGMVHPQQHNREADAQEGHSPTTAGSIDTQGERDGH
jgi:hypothetical protein